MQSCVKIRLKFSCIIGILPKERKQKQRVRIKLKAKSDEFLGYALLCAWLKFTYKKRKFELLEESLEFVASKLKQTHPALSALKISITKTKEHRRAYIRILFFKLTIKLKGAV